MIERAIRAAAAMVAAVVVLSDLGGCDAETASGKTTPPAPLSGAGPRTPASVTSPVPGVPPELERGQVRVTGMIFSASGGGVTPERPFESGSVGAVPLDRFLAVQEALRPDMVVGKYLQKSLAVPQNLFREKRSDIGTLGPDGTYSLGLRPGRYAFCLVEIGGRRPSGTAPGERWIDRWVEVTVTTVELQTVLPVYNRDTGEITVLY
jgi:hypothetical protein